MPRVIRDVEPDRVRDLLERPPRAAVAFVDAGALVAEPVALVLRDGGYCVGRRRSGATLRAGAPVMLVVDDGWHWFELRGVSIRGTVETASDAAAGALEWHRVVPARVVAWDYAALREEGSEGSPGASAGRREKPRPFETTAGRPMRLDDPETQAFLADSMVARVATMSAKGVPFLTPLWFVCHGGRLHMTTGQGTIAVRNAAARPGVVLLCEAERRPTARVLRIHGHATVRPGMPGWPVIVSYARKYYLTPRGLGSELSHWRQLGLRRRYYAQSTPAVIEVTPERVDLP